jgi:hypothetical protein
MTKKTQEEIEEINEDLERKQKEKERAEILRKAHAEEEQKNSSGNKNSVG